MIFCPWGLDFIGINRSLIAHEKLTFLLIECPPPFQLMLFQVEKGIRLVGKIQQSSRKMTRTLGQALAVGAGVCGEGLMVISEDRRRMGGRHEGGGDKGRGRSL